MSANETESDRGERRTTTRQEALVALVQRYEGELAQAWATNMPSSRVSAVMSSLEGARTELRALLQQPKP